MITLTRLNIYVGSNSNYKPKIGIDTTRDTFGCVNEREDNYAYHETDVIIMRAIRSAQFFSEGGVFSFSAEKRFDLVIYTSVHLLDLSTHIATNNSNFVRMRYKYESSSFLFKYNLFKKCFEFVLLYFKIYNLNT